MQPRTSFIMKENDRGRKSLNGSPVYNLQPRTWYFPTVSVDFTYRRAWSDTQVYAPYTRDLLGTAAHLSTAVVLKLQSAKRLGKQHLMKRVMFRCKVSKIWSAALRAALRDPFPGVRTSDFVRGTELHGKFVRHNYILYNL